MTLIIDDSVTRWVDMPPRKRRKPRTGGRFSEIAVGDQIRLEPKVHSRNMDGTPLHRTHESYALVTDLWFDPVAGQETPWKGQMVAIAMIRPDGSTPRKESYSRHALAAVGFQKTDVDYLSICTGRMAALAEGKVVGIRHGLIIRQRPKTPGHRL